MAWWDYGADFMNEDDTKILEIYSETFEEIKKNDGNSIRIWLFCGGDYYPMFNSSGYVIGTDPTNSMIKNLDTLLTSAETYGISVFFSIWNLAVTPSDNLIGLIQDNAKLESFFNIVLIPMVKALSHYDSFSGLEIINEPEGSIIIEKSNIQCQDTTILRNSGAGWVGNLLHMKDIQSFINLHSSVIHQYDSTDSVLVTLGSWNAKACNDALPNSFNYYTDECLITAGNQSNGYLDVYEVHSYSYNGKYDNESPFLNTYSDYDLDKPLIVGEFSQDEGAGRSIEELYQYVYCNGYSGSWAWQLNSSGEGSDFIITILSGMRSFNTTSCS
eukprot:TRINITY_DN2862_c2_g1_i1.p2 TRINITY_DN2862_c2_g1~~TRINITY_DN2862_c2_g1_i1.p2  ORF type:complete len:355 (+),score=104.36 TRINITY_DN2862_c2_g1_i1:79-1065(+)